LTSPSGADAQGDQRGQPGVDAVPLQQRGADHGEAEHRPDRQVKLAHGDQDGHPAGADRHERVLLDRVGQLGERQERVMEQADDGDDHERRDRHRTALQVADPAPQIAA